MDAAGRALAADTRLKAATAEVRLTLEQVVTGVPPEADPDGSGTARWHVRIDQGEVVLATGAVATGGPEADVRFTTDYATGSAIATGRLGAQRAFAAVDDALAAVREATTFPAGGPTAGPAAQ